MIQKFRKKPVVIEAMQWDGTNKGVTPIMDWILSTGSRAASYTAGGQLTIETLEGTMRADPGDWIIRGIQGEHYPCKPDIFLDSYEAVNDEQD